MSDIILGLMRIAQKNAADCASLIDCALDNGINFLDLADIYGGGKSEMLLGEVLKNKHSLREKLFIQSKCGIFKPYYDSSKEHIVLAVDGILRRLNTDRLDSLLIHRPDALTDYSEVAEAFTQLHRQGKVLAFGVSNFSPAQIELMKKYLPFPVKYDQIQLSLVHSYAVGEGMFFNTATDESLYRTGGILEYAYLNDIRVQAWSSLMASWADGCFVDNPGYPQLNAALQALAEKYGVTKNAVAVAWILRLPQGVMPIVGTTDPEHLKEIAAASNIRLTRAEWYSLYAAAGHKIP